MEMSYLDSMVTKVDHTMDINVNLTGFEDKSAIFSDYNKMESPDDLAVVDISEFQPSSVIQEDKEPKSCGGFEENIVLAVKECFYEDEIRRIIIKKTRNGKKVKYFSRNCTTYVSIERKQVCDACDQWFTDISASSSNVSQYCDVLEDSLKDDIGKYLDVKLADEKQNNVKQENGHIGVKKEDDNDYSNDELFDDWMPDDSPVRKASSSRKGKRKIPSENCTPHGYVCRFSGCGKVFSKRKGWFKHDNTHDAKKTCDICGIEVSKLSDHKRRAHGAPDVADWENEESKDWQQGISATGRKRKYSEDLIDDGQYRCRYEDCKKIMETKKIYLKHIYLIHEGGNEKRKKKKICEHCGALISANNMTTHVRTVHTHKDEKNFACEHCGKEFKYRSELTVHLTHHTGEFNYSCTGCAKRFRRALEARLCEKGHKGLYNYSCHLCEYKTHKKSGLDSHMKSHLKITPFTCPICGFKSGRKDNLKQHVEKRHCSNTISIKQMEEMYPDMYKLQESIEAAEQARRDAVAAHKEKMAQAASNLSNQC